MMIMCLFELCATYAGETSGGHFALLRLSGFM